MRRHPAAAGIVLIVGGGLTALLASRQRDLPEVVIALGVTLLLAWALERGSRFGGSGATLAGLGVGLFLAEHAAAFSAYRDELAFGGIALGLLLATRVMPGAVRGAAVGLLALAVAEAALQGLPPRISAPSVYRAFDEGWAFGLLLAAYGIAITVGRSRAMGRGPR